MSIEVSGLSYYPIKSCAGISANELEVAETGFRHDREWMLVGPEGTYMSQRKNPEMALIKPIVDGDVLRVSAPAMEELTVPVVLDADEVVEVTIHKKFAHGQFAGSEVAAWFSEYLKTNARLVQVRPDLPRSIINTYHRNSGTNRVGFADSFAFLLASEASLKELNRHLVTHVPMNRFRPNIVISGNDLTAYDEDFWREIMIGHLRAFIVRACDRCPIPDTDQVTGQRPERLVTAALRKTRHGVDPTDSKMSQGNFFGQNLNHVFEVSQTVRVGQEVVILDRSSERNFIC